MDALEILRTARGVFPDLVPCLLLDEETHTQLVLSLVDRAAHRSENYKLDLADLDRPASDIIAEIVAKRAPTKQG